MHPSEFKGVFIKAHYSDKIITGKLYNGKCLVKIYDEKKQKLIKQFYCSTANSNKIIREIIYGKRDL